MLLPIVKRIWKKLHHKIEFISENFSVFDFPLKRQELNKKWITSANRKDLTPTQHVVFVQNILKKDIWKSANELY